MIEFVVEKCGKNSDTRVNYVYYSGKLFEVNSDDVRKAITAAAVSIGKQRLGVHPDEIRTHSLRSGAAMTMYLEKGPGYTIMLIVCWSIGDFFSIFVKIRNSLVIIFQKE